MGEEAPVLVASWRIVRKVEPVDLEILPEQLGCQGVVEGPVLNAQVGALEGPSNRIARFPMAELHDRPKDPRRYLAEVHGKVTDGGAPTPVSSVAYLSGESGKPRGAPERRARPMTGQKSARSECEVPNVDPGRPVGR